MNTFNTFKISLLALFFTACAHAPVPASFGFYGRRCIPVTEVVCMADKDMSVAFCEGPVHAAVAIVNEALGQDRLHFSGTVPASVENLVAGLNKEQIIVYGDTLQPGVAGLTLAKSAKKAPSPDCLGPTVVMIDKAFTTYDSRAQQYALAVIIHEMLHSIGAEHAPSRGAYHSIMTPALQDPSWANHITVFDRAALRTAYP